MTVFGFDDIAVGGLEVGESSIDRESFIANEADPVVTSFDGDGVVLRDGRCTGEGYGTSAVSLDFVHLSNFHAVQGAKPAEAAWVIGEAPAFLGGNLHAVGSEALLDLLQKIVGFNGGGPPAPA